MKHFNLVSAKSQSTTTNGSKTSQTSGSTVINNITNVTNVTQGVTKSTDNYKGKITVANLLAIDPSTVGENDLYLVYASYSDATGWSKGSYFRLGTSFNIFLSSNKLSETIYAPTKQFEYFFTVEGLVGTASLTIYASDREGTSSGTTYFSGTVSEGTYAFTPSVDSDYISVTASAGMLLSFSEPVPDGSFVQWTEALELDENGSAVVEKKWCPVNVTDTQLDSPAIFNPLPNSISLITGTYPVSISSPLYGETKAGVKIADIQTYAINTDNVYDIQTYIKTGTYAGQTDTRQLVVPYARYYQEGGETIYVGGALTSTDYQRLIEGGTGTQVQSNWTQTDSTAVDFVKNKPATNSSADIRNSTSGVRQFNPSTVSETCYRPIYWLLSATCTEITFSASAQYIALNKAIGATVDLTPITSPSGFHYTILDVTEGDWILASLGTSGSIARAYAWLDADNKLLSVATANTKYTTACLHAPANAAKLVMNRKNSDCTYKSYKPSNIDLSNYLTKTEAENTYLSLDGGILSNNTQYLLQLNNTSLSSGTKFGLGFCSNGSGFATLFTDYSTKLPYWTVGTTEKRMLLEGDAVTDVQVDGISVVSGGVANIQSKVKKYFVEILQDAGYMEANYSDGLSAGRLSLDTSNFFFTFMVDGLTTLAQVRTWLATKTLDANFVSTTLETDGTRQIYRYKHLSALSGVSFEVEKYNASIFGVRCIVNTVPAELTGDWEFHLNIIG